MKIKNQIKINMDENSRTRIGEFVYFEDILLECRKSVSCCNGCYFHDNENMSCRATSNRCFNCSHPGRIFVKE